MKKERIDVDAKQGVKLNATHKKDEVHKEISPSRIES